MCTLETSFGYIRLRSSNKVRKHFDKLTELKGTSESQEKRFFSKHKFVFHVKKKKKKKKKKWQSKMNWQGLIPHSINYFIRCFQSLL